MKETPLKVDKLQKPDERLKKLTSAKFIKSV